MFNFYVILRQNKFMKKIPFEILIILSLLFFTSCVSKKDIVYLQFDDVDSTLVNNDYQLRFKPDDLLQITVSSDDLVSVQPFNLPVVAYSNITTGVFGQPQLQTYLIDKQGNIEFPVLGTIKLGGLTRIEAINLFVSKLQPDLVINPIVNIRISNFRISIQGEVVRPGTFTIPNERISIFDALGMAGGLQISGKRENILVIREEGGTKVQYRVDLRSNSLLTSPVYYLQQNDVIYVEPNNAKIQDAAYTRNTGLFISLASVLISLISVISN